MDLAHALSLDSDNHADLAEQIHLLKDDLSASTSVSDRRILVFLERIFESWFVEPHFASLGLDLDLDDEALILPYKNFLCPLTKEVMKDPVVLETSQTYERTAIQYWSDRCIEDARDPTCPVTGQVLKSLELKPNINLAGADGVVEEAAYSYGGGTMVEQGREQGARVVLSQHYCKSWITAEMGDYGVFPFLHD